MDRNFNEEIGRKFWMKRIRKEYHKYGLRIVKSGHQTLDLPDKNATVEYVDSFVEKVKNGIGDSVPKECVKTMLQTEKNTERINITGFVDLLPPIAELKFKPRIICSFSLGIRDGVVHLCCINNDEIMFDNPLNMKNLVCENPELIGKALADLYLSSDKDDNRCELEIAKANKLKQMTGVGLKAFLNDHLSDIGLEWEMTLFRSGKYGVKVKYYPDLILAMLIDPLKFDNDFAKLGNTIDVLDNIVRKHQKDQKIPEKQKGVEWHFTVS